MNTKKWTALDLVQIALVAGLYVALTLTPPLNAIAYGAYQFRVSEMLNFLAFYNHGAGVLKMYQTTAAVARTPTTSPTNRPVSILPVEAAGLRACRLLRACAFM